MPAFTQQHFLGLSVTDFSCSLGFGSQQSQLGVGLVLDPQSDVEFEKPDPGTPVSFTFGDNFRFDGLIENWDYLESPNGFVYNITIVDPREILAGTQIIIDTYNGSALFSNGKVLSNFVNVFGFMETRGGGFGGAGVNDSGMRWNVLKFGLESLINDDVGAGGFPASYWGGGGLTLLGHTYKIDLSEMPKELEQYNYRLVGPSQTLLDIISQVCEDSGFDFFVELQHGTDGAGPSSNKHTIKIKTVDRTKTPPLEEIQNYIDELRSKADTAKTLISFRRGLVLRNEPTVSIVVGGPVEQFRELSTIYPYFGKTLDGAPIYTQDLNGIRYLRLYSEDLLYIIGQNFYDLQLEEMKASLAGQETWGLFLERFKQSVPQGLNLAAALTPIVDAFRPRSVFDLINDNPLAAQVDLRNLNNSTDLYTALYNFVRVKAEEYYGRQFVVVIPTTVSIEADTNRVVLSDEPTSSATSVTTYPLGLKPSFATVFQDIDGKYTPFVRIDTREVDLSTLDPNDYISFGNSIFVRADMSLDPVFLGVGFGQPAVLIRLPFPVFGRPGQFSPPGFTGVLGDLNRMADYFNTAVSNLRNIFGSTLSGNIDIRMYEDALTPSLVGIPLKSNVATYGPWTSPGAENAPAGKVKFTVDTSLTPWNYGGYINLQAAGETKAHLVSTMQKAETGQVALVGAPLISLGEALRTGAPEVTSMTVSYGADGVNTTYIMETYIRRFGSLEKIYRDKVQFLTNKINMLSRDVLVGNKKIK